MHSINCYRKIVEDGTAVVDAGVVQCNDPRYDKCGTLHFTVDSSIDVEIRSCTRSVRNLDNGGFVGESENTLNLLVAASLYARRCAVIPRTVTRQVGGNRWFSRDVIKF